MCQHQAAAVAHQCTPWRSPRQARGFACARAELTLLYWRRVGSGCGLMLCIPKCSFAWAAALLNTGLPDGRGAESPTLGMRATFCGYSGAVCGLRSLAGQCSVARLADQQWRALAAASACARKRLTAGARICAGTASLVPAHAAGGCTRAWSPAAAARRSGSPRRTMTSPRSPKRGSSHERGVPGPLCGRLSACCPCPTLENVDPCPVRRSRRRAATCCAPVRKRDGSLFRNRVLTSLRYYY
jgi:hypothetical protein